nr:hypothetical protein [Candidatus Phytoplasma tritici]
MRLNPKSKMRSTNGKIEKHILRQTFEYLFTQKIFHGFKKNF